MNTLEFEVHNQTLIRIDSQDVMNKNKNQYKCTFTFEENSEWTELNKFVLFTDGWGNSRTQHLGNNSNVLSCLVPDKMLRGSYFKISVYAGDLITTNTISVNLMDSGYLRRHHSDGYLSCDCDSNNHNKDIFVEIFERLDYSVDSIFYENNTLHLFNRENLLESIYLPFLEEDEIRELVKDLTSEFILELPVANSETNGLMSRGDYVKLDNIECGANRTIVDDKLDEESDNPVENRVIVEALNQQNDTLTNMGDTLSDFDLRLDGKEDVYDYVERLDNLIIDLITKGEN